LYFVVTSRPEKVFDLLSLEHVVVLQNMGQGKKQDSYFRATFLLSTTLHVVAIRKNLLLGLIIKTFFALRFSRSSQLSTTNAHFRVLFNIFFLLLGHHNRERNEQTAEGYISKDIYILSYIQKSPKRIFPILFWSRIF
jgi:hypothetical protein